MSDYVSYIQYTLLNEQAAESVWQDALRTRDRLADSADMLRICDNKKLKDAGYHIIHFECHRYLMLYRIENNIVYVDAVYHELQDYENMFMANVKSY